LCFGGVPPMARPWFLSHLSFLLLGPFLFSCFSTLTRCQGRFPTPFLSTGLARQMAFSANLTVLVPLPRLCLNPKFVTPTLIPPLFFQAPTCCTMLVAFFGLFSLLSPDPPPFLSFLEDKNFFLWQTERLLSCYPQGS